MWISELIHWRYHICGCDQWGDCAGHPPLPLEGIALSPLSLCLSTSCLFSVDTCLLPVCFQLIPVYFLFVSQTDQLSMSFDSIWSIVRPVPSTSLLKVLAAVVTILTMRMIVCFG